MHETVVQIDHLQNLTDRGFSVAFIRNFKEKHGLSLAEMDAAWGFAADYLPADRGEVESLGDPAYTVPGPEVAQIVPLCAADVEPRPVKWLLQDVFVQGALNSVQGIAGLGKSFMLCAVAAAVSSAGFVQSVDGQMERLRAGSVLFLSGDDDASTTLVPRLISLGANRRNVHFAPDGMLPAIGSPELESLFARVKPTLCIFDTLQHFLPAKVDINSANSATNALQPLKRMAELYDCAVVIIQHISKVSAAGNGGFSVNFGIGSSAINGVFRSVWTLGRLKDEEGKPGDIRVLAPSKTNLVPGDPPCVLFELTKERGFLWAGVDYDITAEALYEPAKKTTRRVAPAREEAEQFLADFLTEGKMRTSDIEREAGNRGISAKTLRDARERLGVVVTRGRGTDRFWYWQLAPLPAKEKNGQIGATRDNMDDQKDDLTLFDPDCPTCTVRHTEGQVARGRI